MIGPRHPYGPNNNEVMFNVLGFECKPKEDIYKNTGHFFGKILIFITESQMRGFCQIYKRYCLVFLENAQTSKDCLAHYCQANY